MSGRGSDGGAGGRRRARGARIVLGLAVAVMLLAFFRLQVLRSSRYEFRSEENRLRAISVPAPRGTMYDRDGRVVADNVPGYSVSILPGREDTVRAILERLAPYLSLDSARRASLMDRYRRHPERPLVVRDDATFDQISAIEERRPRFRRAVVEMRPRRRYPPGSSVAHVVGYLGEIDEPALQDTAFTGYESGRIVGRTGLERFYERRLSGEPGVRYVEVNALGSIVREFGPEPAVPPTPGEDLRLGLDLALQAYADSLFPDSLRGGVVALDPSDGEVLALHSHPAFDPNSFVGGVDSETWSRLRNSPREPLLNRVTAAAYSPGSTWKLLVAAEAMRTGEVAIDERMEIPCRGSLQFGIRQFRCWKEEGHGPLDLAGAIRESCNVYFYQLGLRLGLDAMTRAADRWGYGRRTGIDLPHEVSGFFPPSREWYDRQYGRRGWTRSVVLNLAIGQGENDQTLIRQALFYTALATGRAPVVPHLVRDSAAARRRMDWSIELSEERRRELMDAMVSVVNEPGGTAYPWRLDRWTLAGKTGTAQNPQGEPHSWFVGFAPAEDPAIVVAAMVEHGHPDDQTSLAVPLASRVVRRYLARERDGAGADTLPAGAAARGAPQEEPGGDVADGRGRGAP